jgi:acyl-CoA thioesterase FadM
MPAIETFRSVVAPSECDHLGHMNVASYFAAVSDGVFSFQTELGLGPTDLRAGRRVSFAVVRAESDFRLELRAGDVIRVMTAVEAIGKKSVLFRHELQRVEDGAVAFETRFRCVLLDLESRRAVEIPDDLRARTEAYLEPGAR